MSDTEMTSRDYERAADASRQRLASSLDELSSSLTPGRVLDELMTYSRSGGGDFLRGLGNAASQNPVPTLLVGAGLAMFLSGRGSMNGRARSYPARERRMSHDLFEAASEEGDSAMGRIRRGFNSLGSKVGGATSRASEAASSAVSGAADQVSGATDALGSTMANAAGRARDAASSGVEAVGEMAASARDSASDAIGHARDTVSEQSERLRQESARMARHAGDRVSHLAQEQPLMVAAAGLAIGAAIAALLPRTRSEDSLFGETSDAVKEAVGGVASEQYERTKSAASHVAEDLKESAEREGLTPAAAADAVRDLGERVTGVVKNPGDSGGAKGEKPL